MDKPSSFLLCLISFLLFSCTKEITIKLAQVELKPVVNCLFCPGEPFVLNLSIPGNPTDSVLKYIADAKVEITPENRPPQLLTYQKNGNYTNPDFLPQPGVSYKLEINAPGYKTVTATNKIPVPTVKVLQATLKSGHRNEEVTGLGDDASIPVHHFTVTIKDSTNYNDFMAVAVIEFHKRKYYINYSEDKYVIKDEYETGYLNSDDLVFTSEGLENFDQHTMLLFRDVLFTKHENNVEFDMEKVSELRLWLRFYQFSPEAFNYLKSWIIHSYTQSYDFWEIYEPLPLYTNIENGYGIFAGYSSTIHEVFPDATTQF